MTQSKPVVAADICGTLYRTNTTAGMIAHHHMRVGNKLRAQLLTLLTKRRHPVQFALVAIARLTGRDMHRALVLWTLKGEDCDRVDASARDYVATCLPGLAINATQRRLAVMQDAGWAPVLISNAIDPVVRAIASHLGLPALSSRLGRRDGVFTGKLEQDLTGQKRAALEAYLGHALCPDSFTVMTDNRSDRDLVGAAQTAILVARGAPRKWMGEWDAEILCH